MKKVKEHFEDEAKEFDRIISEIVPFYNEMINALVSSIPFSKSFSFKVLDLGCGTGNISYNIKKRFPDSKITCVDLANNMIEIAQKKLSKYDDIKYIITDFRDLKFEEEYEAIVSSLAFHHLTDKDKKRFYKKIYNALSDKGVFYNADNVLGSNKYLQDIYMEKWKDFMHKKVSMGKIERKWLPKHKEEDIPAKLIDQIKWLAEIGFRDVDVIWKYYYFAVYGGSK
jgi:tRNA (cmo5U34)-methyltransferase